MRILGKKFLGKKMSSWLSFVVGGFLGYLGSHFLLEYFDSGFVAPFLIIGGVGTYIYFTWFHDKVEKYRLTKKAGKGDPNAQYDLGWTYLLDEGVEKDPQKAVEWFERAGEAGNVDAQVYLGLMFSCGDDVEQDHSKASVWFKKAAVAGNREAQNYLGWNYENGDGVPQDYLKAAYWYQQASNQGLAEAQYRLGCLYAMGKGMEQNFQKAFELFSDLAGQGNKEALSFLSMMYEHGWGVPQDLANAHLNLTLAAQEECPELNHVALINDLEVLERNMTPSEKSRAQLLAKEWMLGKRE